MATSQISRPTCRAVAASQRYFIRSFTSSRPTFADRVRIVEVGPRDGLQNEKSVITPDVKIELVRRLAGTGLDTIEAGSFVSPNWVAQMAASDQIMQSVIDEPPLSAAPITYQWLLPNMKGLTSFFKILDSAAVKSNESAGYPSPPASPSQNESPSKTTSPAEPIHEVSIFMAATESFNKKNTNCTIAESLSRFKELIQAARDRNVLVRAYISVALGCPFEGPDTDPHQVAAIAASLLEMGADEISVADTTGMGTAPRTRQLLQTLKEAGIRSEDIALHFHDTFGQALLNTLVGLEHGVRTFDSAVGGLGGCPYSPGATGNLATEDLVYFLHSLGVDTGVNLEKVAAVGDWITREIGKGNDSSAGKAIIAKMRREGRIH